MFLLGYCCAALACAFVLHVAVWRVRVPRRQTRSLLLIFFGALVAALALLVGLSRAGGLPPTSRLGPTCLHLVLFHTAITLAYVITYSAVEADSPSLLIVLAVAEAGRDGLPVKRLEERLNDDVLVRPRLANLVRDGTIARGSDGCRLTRKGRAFIRIFIAARRVLGAGKGG